MTKAGVTPDQLVETDEETESASYYGLLPPEEDPYIQAAIKLLKDK